MQDIPDCAFTKKKKLCEVWTASTEMDTHLEAKPVEQL